VIGVGVIALLWGRHAIHSETHQLARVTSKRRCAITLLIVSDYHQGSNERHHGVSVWCLGLENFQARLNSPGKATKVLQIGGSQIGCTAPRYPSFPVDARG
jgi:hypothetical protein